MGWKKKFSEAHNEEIEIQANSLRSVQLCFKIGFFFLNLGASSVFYSPTII